MRLCTATRTGYMCARDGGQRLHALLGRIILVPPAPNKTWVRGVCLPIRCFHRKDRPRSGQPQAINVLYTWHMAQRRGTYGHMVILEQEVTSRQCLSPQQTNSCNMCARDNCHQKGTKRYITLKPGTVMCAGGSQNMFLKKGAILEKH